CLLCTQEASEDVHRKHTLQSLEIDVFGARLALQDARIVDQANQRPELTFGVFEQPNHISLHRDVGAVRRGSCTCCAEFFGKLLGRASVLDVVDAHCVTACGREASRSCPDATTTTRDY